MDSCEMDAISLIPEEVWKYILDFAVYNNEKTLQNCNLTCHLWKQLLRQHNFRLKLSLVLPHLHPYLSGNDILKCRLVSKKWCSVVNQHSSEGEPKNSIKINQAGTRNNFCSYQVFRNMFPNFQYRLEALRNPLRVRAMRRQRTRNIMQVHTKKFIFRSIILTIGPNVSVYADVLAYLTKFEILGRALHLQFPVRQIDRFFFLLTELISRFPKLEYLKVSTIELETTDQITPHDLIGFKLPELNRLKRLDVIDLPDVLQDFFISRYKTQIEASYEETYDTCHVMSQEKEQFMWRGPIKFLQPSVRNHLLTHAHFSISSGNVLTPEFTQGIQNFGQSLRLLSLKYTGGDKWKGNISGNINLALPNINVSLASSFEFLKDLRNLEHLKIQFERQMYARYFQSKGQGQAMLNGTTHIIDLVKYLEEIEELGDDDIVFRTMYKSNIWSLLRKLKSVCIMIYSDDSTEDNVEVKRFYTRRELNELYL